MKVCDFFRVSMKTCPIKIVPSKNKSSIKQVQDPGTPCVPVKTSNKCPCYSVKTNLARSPIRRRAERVKKCIQVHAISSRWKAAQWSTLHIITHHCISLHITRCTLLFQGAWCIYRSPGLSGWVPLEMQLHICKSPDIYGSLFISKIRPMNGKMAFRMVLHLTFCRGGGPALQARVRPFPIVNLWDQNWTTGGCKNKRETIGRALECSAVADFGQWNGLSCFIILYSDHKKHVLCHRTTFVSWQEIQVPRSTETITKYYKHLQTWLAQNWDAFPRHAKRWGRACQSWTGRWHMMMWNWILHKLSR